MKLEFTEIFQVKFLIYILSYIIFKFIHKTVAINPLYRWGN